MGFRAAEPTPPLRCLEMEQGEPCREWAVQRGGVVVCWRRCRSIDMEGAWGAMGVCGGEQQRRSVESTHEGDGEERHSRPQSNWYLRTASQRFGPRDRRETS